MKSKSESVEENARFRKDMIFSVIIFMCFTAISVAKQNGYIFDKNIAKWATWEYIFYIAMIIPVIYIFSSLVRYMN